MKAANINPRTGLATDYLNHFNEAIMLLEMIPDMPECAEDFLTWHPLSYAEHFWASNFKARDLAIEAYESADAKIRTEFDNITSTMTSILTAVGSAMREARQDRTRATLAEQATGWVKPLVALAGGIINGGSEADVETIMASLIARDGLDLHVSIGHDSARTPFATLSGSPLSAPVQPIRPQLAVSGAIFRDGKILLVRRARSPAKGFYSLPGGRVEFGESLHTALHREVDEETGPENRDFGPRRMARSAAGSRRRRALSDHVVRRALDGPGAGSERRARRFQMAGAGYTR